MLKTLQTVTFVIGLRYKCGARDIQFHKINVRISVLHHPDPLIVNPDCRDYESSTFQCAELEKYNFCTDTSSVAYAIAHEKCAKHCGFCSLYHASTMAPDTPAPTTMGVATDAQTTIVASSSGPDTTVQTTTLGGNHYITYNTT